jgi:hypothetical protein
MWGAVKGFFCFAPALGWGFACGVGLFLIWIFGLSLILAFWPLLDFLLVY